MALHFNKDEFADRKSKLLNQMAAHNLDAMLLFAQESMYWLTGFDTFGFCFFQCMIVEKSGDVALLTRSADLRQAQHTSNVENIIIWEDRDGANPAIDLKNVLTDRGLKGAKIGVEYETAGLNGYNCKRLEAALLDFANLEDQSNLVGNLRLIKSQAELAYVRRAGELADEAFEAARPHMHAGGDEADILAAMHSAIFAGGGDYPANEFIIGSGEDALLCRYKSGRRKLDPQDQLTLEWAGTYRHYHAAMMATVVIGTPSARHVHMHEVGVAALKAVEDTMRPGNTFGDVFAAHAKVVDDAGLNEHRLNACGYSLGTRFTPSWMDMPMFYANNPAIIEPNMVLFAHMILADSETNTGMMPGRSYITTETRPQCLSNLSLDLIAT